MEDSEKADSEPLPKSEDASPSQGKSCALCGCATPAVRCDRCNSQTFCLSCDDMYHRHPKRKLHLRKAVESIWSTARSPRLRRRTELPGDPCKIPIPPPRSKKRERHTIIGGGRMFLKSGLELGSFGHSKVFDPKNLPTSKDFFTGQKSPASMVDSNCDDISNQNMRNTPSQLYENENIANPGGNLDDRSPWNATRPNISSPIQVSIPSSSPDIVANGQSFGYPTKPHSQSAADLSGHSSHPIGPHPYHFHPPYPYMHPSMHPYSHSMAHLNCAQCISSSWSNLMSPHPSPYFHPMPWGSAQNTMGRGHPIPGQPGQPGPMKHSHGDLVSYPESNFHYPFPGGGYYHNGPPVVDPNFIKDLHEQAEMQKLKKEATGSKPSPRNEEMDTSASPVPVENEPSSASNPVTSTEAGASAEQDVPVVDELPPLPEKPTEPWSCIHCTFINPPGSYICQVCCKTGYRNQRSKPAEEEEGDMRPLSRDSESPLVNRDAFLNTPDMPGFKEAQKDADIQIESPFSESELRDRPVSSDISETSAKLTTETQTSTTTKTTDAQTQNILFKSIASSTDSIFLKQEISVQTEVEAATQNCSVATDPMISSQSMESLLSGVSAPPYHNRRAGWGRGATSFSTQSLYERGRSRSPMPRSHSIEAHHLGRNSNYASEEAMHSASQAWLYTDPMYYKPHNQGGLTKEDYFDGTWGSMDKLNHRVKHKKDKGKLEHMRPKFHRSLDDLKSEKRPEIVHTQELLMLQTVKEAERCGFSLEDLHVAYLNCGKENPVYWLEDNWSSMIKNVIALAAKYGEDNEENDVGPITLTEAKDALRIHRGDIWDAVTEVIENRQRKILELTVRGNFTQKQIAEALKNNEGNVELAYADLVRASTRRHKFILSPGLSEDSEDLNIYNPIEDSAADHRVSLSPVKAVKRDVSAESKTEKKKSDFLTKLSTIRQAQSERRKAREEKELIRETITQNFPVSVETDTGIKSETEMMSISREDSKEVEEHIQDIAPQSDTEAVVETESKAEVETPAVTKHLKESTEDSIPVDFDTNWSESQGEWIEEYSDEQWEGEEQWVGLGKKFQKMEKEFEEEAMQMAALWEKEELEDDVFEEDTKAQTEAEAIAESDKKFDDWVKANLKVDSSEYEEEEAKEKPLSVVIPSMSLRERIEMEVSCPSPLQHYRTKHDLSLKSQFESDWVDLPADAEIEKLAHDIVCEGSDIENKFDEAEIATYEEEQKPMRLSEHGSDEDWEKIEMDEQLQDVNELDSFAFPDKEGDFDRNMEELEEQSALEEAQITFDKDSKVLYKNLEDMTAVDVSDVGVTAVDSREQIIDEAAVTSAGREKLPSEEEDQPRPPVRRKSKLNSAAIEEALRNQAMSQIPSDDIPPALPEKTRHKETQQKMVDIYALPDKAAKINQQEEDFASIEAEIAGPPAVPQKPPRLNLSPTTDDAFPKGWEEEKGPEVPRKILSPKEGSPLSLFYESDSNCFADSESDTEIKLHRQKKELRKQAKYENEFENKRLDTKSRQQLENLALEEKGDVLEEKGDVLEESNFDFDLDDDIDPALIEPLPRMKDPDFDPELPILLAGRGSRLSDLDDVNAPKAFREDTARPLQLFKAVKRETPTNTLSRASPERPEEETSFISRISQELPMPASPPRFTPSLQDNANIQRDSMEVSPTLPGSTVYENQQVDRYYYNEIVTPEQNLARNHLVDKQEAIDQLQTVQEMVRPVEIEQETEQIIQAVPPVQEQQDEIGFTEMEGISAAVDYFFGRYNEITVSHPKKKSVKAKPPATKPEVAMSTSEIAPAPKAEAPSQMEQSSTAVLQSEPQPELVQPSSDIQTTSPNQQRQKAIPAPAVLKEVPPPAEPVPSEPLSFADDYLFGCYTQVIVPRKTRNKPAVPGAIPKLEELRAQKEHRQSPVPTPVPTPEPSEQPELPPEEPVDQELEGDEVEEIDEIDEVTIPSDSTSLIYDDIFHDLPPEMLANQSFDESSIYYESFQDAVEEMQASTPITSSVVNARPKSVHFEEAAAPVVPPRRRAPKAKTSGPTTTNESYADEYLFRQYEQVSQATTQAKKKLPVCSEDFRMQHGFEPTEFPCDTPLMPDEQEEDDISSEISVDIPSKSIESSKYTSEYEFGVSEQSLDPASHEDAMAEVMDTGSFVACSEDSSVSVTTVSGVTSSDIKQDIVASTDSQSLENAESFEVLSIPEQSEEVIESSLVSSDYTVIKESEIVSEELSSTVTESQLNNMQASQASDMKPYEPSVSSNIEIDQFVFIDQTQDIIDDSYNLYDIQESLACDLNYVDVKGNIEDEATDDSEQEWKRNEDRKNYLNASFLKSESIKKITVDQEETLLDESDKTKLRESKDPLSLADTKLKTQESAVKDKDEMESFPGENLESENLKHDNVSEQSVSVNLEEKSLTAKMLAADSATEVLDTVERVDIDSEAVDSCTADETPIHECISAESAEKMLELEEDFVQVDQENIESVDEGLVESVDKKGSESIDYEVTESIDQEITESVDQEITEFIDKEAIESIDQEVIEPVDEEVTESVDHEGTESIDHEITEFIDQEVTESVDQEGTESIDYEITESIDHEITEFIDQEVTESVDQEGTESIDYEITESIDQELTESVDQEGTESMDHEITESIDQVVTESVDQEIDESIDQEIDESIDQEIAESVVQPHPEICLEVSEKLHSVSYVSESSNLISTQENVLESKEREIEGDGLSTDEFDASEDQQIDILEDLEALGELSDDNVSSHSSVSTQIHVSMEIGSKEVEGDESSLVFEQSEILDNDEIFLATSLPSAVISDRLQDDENVSENEDFEKVEQLSETDVSKDEDFEYEHYEADIKEYKAHSAELTPTPSFEETQTERYSPEVDIGESVVTMEGTLEEESQICIEESMLKEEQKDTTEISRLTGSELETSDIKDSLHTNDMLLEESKVDVSEEQINEQELSELDSESLMAEELSLQVMSHFYDDLYHTVQPKAQFTLLSTESIYAKYCTTESSESGNESDADNALNNVSEDLDNEIEVSLAENIVEDVISYDQFRESDIKLDHLSEELPPKEEFVEEVKLHDTTVVYAKMGTPDEVLSQVQLLEDSQLELELMQQHQEISERNIIVETEITSTVQEITETTSVYKDSDESFQRVNDQESSDANARSVKSKFSTSKSCQTEDSFEEDIFFDSFDDTFTIPSYIHLPIEMQAKPPTSDISVQCELISIEDILSSQKISTVTQIEGVSSEDQVVRTLQESSEVAKPEKEEEPEQPELPPEEKEESSCESFEDTDSDIFIESPSSHDELDVGAKKGYLYAEVDSDTGFSSGSEYGWTRKSEWKEKELKKTAESSVTKAEAEVRSLQMTIASSKEKEASSSTQACVIESSEVEMETSTPEKDVVSEKGEIETVTEYSEVSPRDKRASPIPSEIFERAITPVAIPQFPSFEEDVVFVEIEENVEEITEEKQEEIVSTTPTVEYFYGHLPETVKIESPPVNDKFYETASELSESMSLTFDRTESFSDSVSSVPLSEEQMFSAINIDTKELTASEGIEDESFADTFASLKTDVDDSISEYYPLPDSAAFLAARASLAESDIFDLAQNEISDALRKDSLADFSAEIFDKEDVSNAFAIVPEHLPSDDKSKDEKFSFEAPELSPSQADESLLISEIKDTVIHTDDLNISTEIHGKLETDNKIFSENAEMKELVGSGLDLSTEKSIKSDSESMEVPIPVFVPEQTSSITGTEPVISDVIQPDVPPVPSDIVRYLYYDDSITFDDDSFHTQSENIEIPSLSTEVISDAADENEKAPFSVDVLEKSADEVMPVQSVIQAEEILATQLMQVSVTETVLSDELVKESSEIAIKELHQVQTFSASDVLKDASLKIDEKSSDVKAVSLVEETLPTPIHVQEAELCVLKEVLVTPEAELKFPTVEVIASENVTDLPSTTEQIHEPVVHIDSQIPETFNVMSIPSEGVSSLQEDFESENVTKQRDFKQVSSDVPPVPSDIVRYLYYGDDISFEEATQSSFHSQSDSYYASSLPSDEMHPQIDSDKVSDISTDAVKLELLQGAEFPDSESFSEILQEAEEVSSCFPVEESSYKPDSSSAIGESFPAFDSSECIDNWFDMEEKSTNGKKEKQDSSSTKSSALKDSEQPCIPEYILSPKLEGDLPIGKTDVDEVTDISTHFTMTDDSDKFSDIESDTSLNFEEECILPPEVSDQIEMGDVRDDRMFESCIGDEDEINLRTPEVKEIPGGFQFIPIEQLEEKLIDLSILTESKEQEKFDECITSTEFSEQHSKEQFAECLTSSEPHDQQPDKLIAEEYLELEEKFDECIVLSESSGQKLDKEHIEEELKENHGECITSTEISELSKEQFAECLTSSEPHDQQADKLITEEYLELHEKFDECIVSSELSGEKLDKEHMKEELKEIYDECITSAEVSELSKEQFEECMTSSELQEQHSSQIITPEYFESSKEIVPGHAEEEHKEIFDECIASTEASELSKEQFTECSTSSELFDQKQIEEAATLVVVPEHPDNELKDSPSDVQFCLDENGNFPVSLDATTVLVETEVQVSFDKSETTPKSSVDKEDEMDISCYMSPEEGSHEAEDSFVIAESDESHISPEKSELSSQTEASKPSAYKDDDLDVSSYEMPHDDTHSISTEVQDDWCEAESKHIEVDESIYDLPLEDINNVHIDSNILSVVTQESKEKLIMHEAGYETKVTELKSSDLSSEAKEKEIKVDVKGEVESVKLLPEVSDMKAVTEDTKDKIESEKSEISTTEDSLHTISETSDIKEISVYEEPEFDIKEMDDDKQCEILTQFDAFKQDSMPSPLSLLSSDVKNISEIKMETESEISTTLREEVNIKCMSAASGSEPISSLGEALFDTQEVQLGETRSKELCLDEKVIASVLSQPESVSFAAKLTTDAAMERFQLADEVDIFESAPSNIIKIKDIEISKDEAKDLYESDFKLSEVVTEDTSKISGIIDEKKNIEKAEIVDFKGQISVDSIKEITETRHHEVLSISQDKRSEAQVSDIFMGKEIYHKAEDLTEIVDFKGCPVIDKDQTNIQMKDSSAIAKEKAESKALEQDKLISVSSRHTPSERVDFKSEFIRRDDKDSGLIEIVDFKGCPVIDKDESSTKVEESSTTKEIAESKVIRQEKIILSSDSSISSEIVDFKGMLVLSDDTANVKNVEILESDKDIKSVPIVDEKKFRYEADSQSFETVDLKGQLIKDATKEISSEKERVDFKSTGAVTREIQDSQDSAEKLTTESQFEIVDFKGQLTISGHTETEKVEAPVSIEKHKVEKQTDKAEDSSRYALKECKYFDKSELDTTYETVDFKGILCADEEELQQEEIGLIQKDIISTKDSIKTEGQYEKIEKDESADTVDFRESIFFSYSDINEQEKEYDIRTSEDASQVLYSKSVGYDIGTQEPYGYEASEQPITYEQPPYDYEVYEQPVTYEQPPYGYEAYEQPVTYEPQPYGYDYDQIVTFEPQEQEFVHDQIMATDAVSYSIVGESNELYSCVETLSATEDTSAQFYSMSDDAEDMVVSTTSDEFTDVPSHLTESSDKWSDVEGDLSFEDAEVDRDKTPTRTVGDSMTAHLKDKEEFGDAVFDTQESECKIKSDDVKDEISSVLDSSIFGIAHSKDKEEFEDAVFDTQESEYKIKSDDVTEEISPILDSSKDIIGNVVSEADQKDILLDETEKSETASEISKYSEETVSQEVMTTEKVADSVAVELGKDIETKVVGEALEEMKDVEKNSEISEINKDVIEPLESQPGIKSDQKEISHDESLKTESVKELEVSIKQKIHSIDSAGLLQTAEDIDLPMTEKSGDLSLVSTTEDFTDVTTYQLTAEESDKWSDVESEDHLLEKESEIYLSEEKKASFDTVSGTDIADQVVSSDVYLPSDDLTKDIQTEQCDDAEAPMLEHFADIKSINDQSGVVDTFSSFDAETAVTKTHEDASTDISSQFEKTESDRWLEAETEQSLSEFEEDIIASAEGEEDRQFEFTDNEIMLEEMIAAIPSSQLQSTETATTMSTSSSYTDLENSDQTSDTCADISLQGATTENSDKWSDIEAEALIDDVLYGNVYITENVEVPDFPQPSKQSEEKAEKAEISLSDNQLKIVSTGTEASAEISAASKVDVKSKIETEDIKVSIESRSESFTSKSGSSFEGADSSSMNLTDYGQSSLPTESSSLLSTPSNMTAAGISNDDLTCVTPLDEESDKWSDISSGDTSVGEIDEGSSISLKAEIKLQVQKSDTVSSEFKVGLTKKEESLVEESESFDVKLKECKIEDSVKQAVTIYPEEKLQELQFHEKQDSADIKLSLETKDDAKEPSLSADIFVTSEKCVPSSEQKVGVSVTSSDYSIKIESQTKIESEVIEENIHSELSEAKPVKTDETSRSKIADESENVDSFTDVPALTSETSEAYCELERDHSFEEIESQHVEVQQATDIAMQDLVSETYGNALADEEYLENADDFVLDSIPENELENYEEEEEEYSLSEHFEINEDELIYPLPYNDWIEQSFELKEYGIEAAFSESGSDIHGIGIAAEEDLYDDEDIQRAIDYNISTFEETEGDVENVIATESFKTLSNDASPHLKLSEKEFDTWSTADAPSIEEELIEQDDVLSKIDELLAEDFGDLDTYEAESPLREDELKEDIEYYMRKDIYTPEEIYDTDFTQIDSSSLPKDTLPEIDKTCKVADSETVSSETTVKDSSDLLSADKGLKISDYEAQSSEITLKKDSMQKLKTESNLSKESTFLLESSKAVSEETKVTEVSSSQSEAVASVKKTSAKEVETAALLTGERKIVKSKAEEFASSSGEAVESIAVTDKQISSIEADASVKLKGQIESSKEFLTTSEETSASVTLRDSKQIKDQSIDSATLSISDTAQSISVKDKQISSVEAEASAKIESHAKSKEFLTTSEDASTSVTLRDSKQIKDESTDSATVSVSDTAQSISVKSKQISSVEAEASAKVESHIKSSKEFLTTSDEASTSVTLTDSKQIKDESTDSATLSISDTAQSISVKGKQISSVEAEASAKIESHAKSKEFLTTSEDAATSVTLRDSKQIKDESTDSATLSISDTAQSISVKGKQISSVEAEASAKIESHAKSKEFLTTSEDAATSVTLRDSKQIKDESIDSATVSVSDTAQSISVKSKQISSVEAEASAKVESHVKSSKEFLTTSEDASTSVTLRDAKQIKDQSVDSTRLSVSETVQSISATEAETSMTLESHVRSSKDFISTSEEACASVISRDSKQIKDQSTDSALSVSETVESTCVKDKHISNVEADASVKLKSHVESSKDFMSSSEDASASVILSTSDSGKRVKELSPDGATLSVFESDSSFDIPSKKLSKSAETSEEVSLKAEASIESLERTESVHSSQQLSKSLKHSVVSAAESIEVQSNIPDQQMHKDDVESTSSSLTISKKQEAADSLVVEVKPDIPKKTRQRSLDSKEGTPVKEEKPSLPPKKRHSVSSSPSSSFGESLSSSSSVESIGSFESAPSERSRKSSLKSTDEASMHSLTPDVPARRSRSKLSSSSRSASKDSDNSSAASRSSSLKIRRRSSNFSNFRDIEPIDLSKKRASIDERILKLQNEGKCVTRERAFIAAKLIEMQFEEEDALLASRQCNTVYHAVKFLTQLCEMCNCRFPINMMSSMVHCTHRACKECLKAHFTSLIYDRSVFTLLCPICQKPDITDQNIQEYFNHLDMMLRNFLDDRVYDLFQRKLRDEVLTKDPNFHWCSQCSSGFYASPRLKKLYCPDCSAITCALCHQTYELEHEGVHCERFQQWKDMHTPEPPPAGLVKFLVDRGVSCPSCDIVYAQACAGCMMYKCSHCSFEFCGFCSRPCKRGRDCANPTCDTRGLHIHHVQNCLFFLRDKDLMEIQMLLEEESVTYLTIPPKDQIVKSRCQVREQKNVHGVISEDRCGRSIEPYCGGLCSTHYYEYLAGLLRKKSISPLSIMTIQDLQFMLRKSRILVPERMKGETSEEYYERLLNLVSTTLT